jgi:hypothetical protein
MTLNALMYGFPLENRDYRELGKLKKLGALPIALPTAPASRPPTTSNGHGHNRRWAREHPGQRDEAWFKREIAPKLDAFLLKEIGKATGLSLAACSRVRAGAKAPHPRHWQALVDLLNAKQS